MSVIQLSADTFLSTEDGTIITRGQAERIIANAVLRTKNLTVSDTLAKVVGRDRQVINLNLQGLDTAVQPTQGFLIQVYLSSSQGLQRMYQKRVVDPADLTVIRGSYTDYIDLEFDV